MKITLLNDKNIILKTIGMEKNAFDNIIEYEDSTITFMIFTYPSIKVIYVINNAKQNDFIPQVKGKVNKICTFTNKDAVKFEKFINENTKNGNKELFYFPPMFFREAFFIIKEKCYKEKLNILYYKYKQNLNRNFSYPSL